MGARRAAQTDPDSGDAMVQRGEQNKGAKDNGIFAGRRLSSERQR